MNKVLCNLIWFPSLVFVLYFSNIDVVHCAYGKIVLESCHRKLVVSAFPVCDGLVCQSMCMRERIRNEYTALLELFFSAPFSRNWPSVANLQYL